MIYTSFTNTTITSEPAFGGHSLHSKPDTRGAWRFCLHLARNGLAFASLLFLLAPAMAQEMLIDLSSLPLKGSNEMQKVQSNKSPLELPFFDDFARDEVTPNRQYWQDSHVLINQTYAINPPTIGVATFDAINRKGELYSHLTTTSKPMDYLTSNPINLHYPQDTSIYFSFFYQPQGLGNQPDPGDSLVLEFLDTEGDGWVRVWSVSANFSKSTVTERNHLTGKIRTTKDTLGIRFFRVHFPILDYRFLVPNFQFRFMNYASLAENSQVAGMRGNCDHWSIDMVYINRNRSYNDLFFQDVAFTKPLVSLLKNYESIPWKHLTDETIRTELGRPINLQITYKNLGSEVKNVMRYFVVDDLSNPANKLEFSRGGNELDLQPFEELQYTAEFYYTFASAWADSAKIALTSLLERDNDILTRHLRWNDTIHYTQRFHNYYAYDDGSAENGYGIFGDGTQNGMVAVKFNSYVEDTLKGVYIYFNRTFNDANVKEYLLTVWNDNKGKPGSIVYQSSKTVPKLTDSLNKFALYSIDEPVKLSGTFYIGWKQLKTEMLNVGFDRNRVRGNKLFYNIYGTWEQSQYEGSLMIRPVFGKLTHSPTQVERNTLTAEATIFPNPAQTSFLVRVSQETQVRGVRVMNLTGTLIFQSPSIDQPIDVSAYTPGVYLVQVLMNGGRVITKKLVVTQ